MTDTQCRDCGRVYDDLTAVELASMAANRGCPSDDCPQREAEYRRTLALRAPVGWNGRDDGGRFGDR